MQNLFGFLTTPDSVDTVIAVKHTGMYHPIVLTADTNAVLHLIVLAVCWLAINQSVRLVPLLSSRRLPFSHNPCIF